MAYAPASAAGHTEPVPEYLLTEVKPYTTTKERETFDNLSTLYSILLTIDHLERAYVKDAVPAEEYEVICKRLIAQYKGALNLVRAEISNNVEQFLKEYRLTCGAALHRVRIGVPATVDFGGADQGGKEGITRYTANAVTNFITLMDSLQLEMKAVDEIHPYLSDLMTCLNKITTLSVDFPAKVKIREWLTTLNSMKASDELSDEQKRQLLFDLETSLNLFKESLN